MGLLGKLTNNEGSLTPEPQRAIFSPQEVLEAVDKMGFHILATTRNEDAVPAGERWCRLPVAEIGEDDALLILKKCSNASGSVPRGPALQVIWCSMILLASRVVENIQSRCFFSAHAREKLMKKCVLMCFAGCKRLRVSSPCLGHCGIHPTRGRQPLISERVDTAPLQAPGKGDHAANEGYRGEVPPRRLGCQL